MLLQSDTLYILILSQAVFVPTPYSACLAEKQQIPIV
jgi:hypothetical protein